MLSAYCMFVFFFFQAEDGIRDHCVTGVQTCALPISFRFFSGSPAMDLRNVAYRSERVFQSFNPGSCERNSINLAPVRRITPILYSVSASAVFKSLASEIGRASCRERG